MARKSKFSVDVRRQFVEEAAKTSVREVAMKAGVSAATIRYWMRTLRPQTQNNGSTGGEQA